MAANSQAQQVNADSAAASSEEGNVEAAPESQPMVVESPTGSQGADQPSSADAADETVHATAATHVMPATTPATFIPEPLIADANLESGEVSDSAMSSKSLNREGGAATSADGPPAASVDDDASDPYEPPDATQLQSADQMALDSSPFSPAPAEITDSQEMESDMTREVVEERSSPLPIQTSTAVISANDPGPEEHAEQVDAAREVPFVPCSDDERSYI